MNYKVPAYATDEIKLLIKLYLKVLPYFHSYFILTLHNKWKVMNYHFKVKIFFLFYYCITILSLSEKVTKKAIKIFIFHAQREKMEAFLKSDLKMLIEK